MQPAVVGRGREGADQADGAAVLEVMVKDSIGDADVAVAQAVVEDLQNAVAAQEGGVELDGGVQPAVDQQVAGDGLDLVGRAAVHGGQGHVVADARGDGQPAEARPLLGHGLVLGDERGGVGQAVHEGHHGLAADALEVVADAHVEDRAQTVQILPAQDAGAGRG